MPLLVFALAASRAVLVAGEVGTRGFDKNGFGEKEGSINVLRDKGDATDIAVGEHSFFLRGSEEWIPDPVVWGHQKLQMTFPAWHQIADITVRYPEGKSKPDETIDLQHGSIILPHQVENYTRGTPLWPFVEKHTAHIKDRAPIIWLRSELCKILEAGHYSKPHVIVSMLGDNWGSLATQIPDRTTQWGDLKKSLKQCGRTLDDVWKYLNHENLLMFVVTQHQHPEIAGHPKVFPIPLGVAAPEHSDLIVPLAKSLIAGNYYKKLHRKKLFYINNSGWKHRKKINAMLNKAFPGAWDEKDKKYGAIQRQETVCCGNVDKFCNFAQAPNKKPMPFGCQKYLPYLEDMLQSKFVLCPSGMGYDSYRHMEVLYMGAIPVFEKYAGFNMTYHDLPVLMVDSYKQLNPAFLEEQYPKILAKYSSFNWKRLSFHYYSNHVMEASKSKSASK